MDDVEQMKFGYEKDLPVGDMNVVKAGDREVLLVRLDTGIYALDNFCSHGGCRLGYGKLEGETIRCLCHGSVFDVKTGEVLGGLATKPQPIYTVIIKAGEITLAP
jgi:3-phenylpropionate/trans-cinnamate dioxygenase ferredoxin subunit